MPSPLCMEIKTLKFKNRFFAFANFITLYVFEIRSFDPLLFYLSRREFISLFLKATVKEYQLKTCLKFAKM